MTFEELETISGYAFQKRNADNPIAAIGRQVGYHNYFRVGVIEATNLVREKLPAGWNASWADRDETIPTDYTVYRVGQVRVYSGGPHWVLYIYKEPEDNR